jgi:membrane fusion protein, protease secretion system
MSQLEADKPDPQVDPKMNPKVDSKAESQSQASAGSTPESTAIVTHGEDLEAKKSNALVVQFRELDKKADTWIKSWNPYHPDLVKMRPLQSVQIEESRIRKVAAKFFLIAFGVFFLWAIFAPIDAGVPATGTVMVSGYRKSLQHPTGGVVQDILVKEGDVVKEGDILIRINPLKAEADLSTAQLQYINALVVEARLKAERKGDAKISWPSDLDAWQGDPKVEEAKQIQQKLFETRRNEIVAVLNGKRIQLDTLIVEARNNAQLAKEGYVPQSQANMVLRSKVDTELQFNQMQAAYYKEIENQLGEIQKTRDALKDRFQAVAFERDLTSIRAPVSGTVVGLKVNTKGGTVASGQVLAEVVPDEVALIVDAQVPPQYIDNIFLGQKVDLRFTSFNQNITPVIPGKVKLVGADRIKPVDGKGEDYYLAQVEATKEGLDKLGSLKIVPGMPVDVIMKTGERSFLSLLIKPLTDKFAKAFIGDN